MPSVREKEGIVKQVQLARDYSIEVEVKLAPLGSSWYVIE